MKKILTLAFTFTITMVIAQNPVGIFADHKDIGNPKLKGDVVYNAADQSYQLKAGGYNIWFGRDEFHYAFNKLKGDFILTANFKLIGKGADPHRKYGWMIRAGEEDNAAHMTATVHGDGLVAMQWRRMKGAYMRDPQDELFTKKKACEIVQLERSGKIFIMRVANAGEPLQEVGRTDAVDMPDEVLGGIILCSHNADVTEEAIAWNVRQELIVPDTYNGYQDGILGSKLEIVNVFDGKRKIIHEDKGRFEAPNWMKDGKSLLFNKDGLIWQLPVEGGTPVQLNTGNAKRNNNDHVISFDGKWLAISSHRDGMPGGGSTIYYLPITGGEPTLVTDSTPSYLHGWSVNGKEIVYTAQRTSKSQAYNIYKKPINGGAETPLTFLEKGLADGPEYSPDGKYIYFNSTASGNMQLWRMKPDGSEQTQLTFDEYNNWFAHISPDNKWIAFLSFPNTVDAGDHPFYKRVMLRLMPVNGTGAPKVIAYLFGGQGTINTPSWSPDSKYIAFVSNTGPVNK
ncbi:MAG: TolB family protein [Sphingobacteriales bacterium]|nr:TolB family protein [Sphingobacteriales bacterium]MBI3717608.1 TolB family protein [Sphingobacteriales bacterium]